MVYFRHIYPTYRRLNLNCRHCFGENLIKRGTRQKKYKVIEQYQCKDCKKYTSDVKRNTTRSARILLLDIETSLMEFYAFSPKVEYIPHDAMIKDWSVLCWGAKWLFEDKVMGETVAPREAINRQDRSVLGGMWELINQADIIVTQNGINFDLPKLNSRFILNGLPPPSHHLNVDTLKVARETFKMSYNRLDFLGEKFGIGKKTDMEFADWIHCSNGSQEHLDKMFDYCKRDVAPLLEDVYLHMLPWVKGHPNMNLFKNHDRDVCPACESEDIKWGERYITPTGIWNGFRCQTCGALGRGTTNKHKIKNVNIRSN